MKSASPNSAQQHNNVGLGLVTTATSPDPLPLSGDNVSSMIVMTSPAAGTDATEPEVTEENVQSAAIEEDEAAPAPAPKPKAKPRTQSAEAAGPVSARPARREAEAQAERAGRSPALAPAPLGTFL